MGKYWSELDEVDYRFVPLPRVFITGFKEVSIQAKWVYSILLDRLMTSRKNADRFSDDEGLFLYFKLNDMAELLGISTRTVTRIFDELKEKGLMQAKMEGMGRPQKIYLVKLSELAKQVNAKESKQTRQNCLDGVDKTVYTDSTNLSRQTRQNCLDSVDKSVTSVSTNLSSPIESNTKRVKQSEKNIFRASPKNERFKPPTVEEVQAYIAEKGFTFSAEEFVASNEQKGWVVGRNQTPMKNWKAACTIWQKNQSRFGARDKPVAEDLDKKWGILNYDEYLAKEQKENGREDESGVGTFGAGIPPAGFGLFEP